MARLARALGTDSLADVDLRQLAKKVRAQGRGRDTVLAHITPAEAKLLKARGGRGSINPKTGLPEFEDDFYDFGGGGDYSGGYDGSGGGVEESSQTYVDPVATPPDSSGGGANTSQGQTALTPEQQTRLDETVAAIRDPNFFEPDLPLPPDPSTPEALEARQQFDAINPAIAARADAPAPDQNFFQRLSSGLGLGGLGNIGGADLARLGLAGAGVGMGVQARNAALAAARNAQTNIQGVGDTAKRRADDVRTDLGNVSVNIASRADPAKADFQALAEPYQKQGKELIQAALSGTLSPSSAQTYQAAEARMNQAQSRSGGVGAAQGVAQLETLRQSLLSNQYQEGLKVQQYGDQLARQGITTGLAQANLGSAAEADAIKSALAAAGISDTYTLRAIQAGLEGNREASRLSAGYFQALGSLLGGTPALRTSPAATTTPGA
jgi:hypothetical protein